MIEAGVLIDKNGCPFHWHLPEGRTGGSIPDTRSLWDVIWDNRDHVLGFAHSHPGGGIPAPSWTDLTTFAAIEAALGRRLYWWITSSEHFIRLEWCGPEKTDYGFRTSEHTPDWVGELRMYSDHETDGVELILTMGS